ncbi:hypothetical protein AC578_5554 [Pseudocercospora eumusae]|uniref:Uncharacterized protein n=1 Tax=Pseudocercospora eumusae TaxID=321146 RepID=A0A139GWS5_9PEZI|nr:hypothetical protein AC578_5554 [Pseudocercospora eumusae]
MVLGILTAVVACPAIIGTTEAIRHGQRNNQREEHRGRKHNLVVTLLNHNDYSARFNGASIVLANKKLWIDTTGQLRRAGAHPYTGYFLPFHNMEQVWRQQGYRRGEGMVSTISHDPPFLNWIYVDKNTHEVKYGIRDEAEPNLVGPFDVTKTDRRLNFQGWEGFVAVEEKEDSGLWALYFDVEDDGLTGEERVGTQNLRMLALEVWRKELRMDREAAVEEREERLRAREEHDNKSERSAETTVS